MSNPNASKDDPKELMIQSLEKRLLEVTQELHKAHKIIFNAMQLMSIEQRCAWAKANHQAGVKGEGIARNQEREGVMKRMCEVAL
jgi:hypothetical protein